MRWIFQKSAKKTPLAMPTWSSLSAFTGAPHTHTGFGRRMPGRATQRGAGGAADGAADGGEGGGEGDGPASATRTVDRAAVRTDAPPSERASDRNAVAAALGVRLRRYYLAAAFSWLYVIVLGVFWWCALLDTRTWLVAAGSVLLSCAVFYAAFTLGWNSRLRDPSLTMAMALNAVCVMVLVSFFAPATQIVFAPFIFCNMAFAAVRVSVGKLMIIGAAALLGNAVVLLLHQVSLKNPALLQLELLHWLVLAVTLPAFALLATRIHQLRHALVSAGAHIKSIEKSAQRDALTACYGRKYVFAKLEALCRGANKFDQPLCAAVLDIDHFKQINDTLGHLGGDAVLRDFVFLCQTAVRDTDILGRYGGEEFLLILPNTSLLTAVATCERIRAVIATQDWGLPGRKAVTVSIGVTRYEAGESALEFFARADAAMYAAKQDGRNQVVLQEKQSFSRHD